MSWWHRRKSESNFLLIARTFSIPLTTMFDPHIRNPQEKIYVENDSANRKRTLDWCAFNPLFGKLAFTVNNLVTTQFLAKLKNLSVENGMLYQKLVSVRRKIKRLIF